MRRSSAPAALLALAGLALPLLASCNNACQALCHEIADFAKAECGLEFSEAELDTCIADHASGNLAEGEAKVCRDGRGDVALEWDCDEVEAYFQDDFGNTGTGADTGE